MSTIRTWSYSRLTDFEQCRYRAKLKYVDHVPEPPRPLPAGKTEHANERGSRVHEAAEAYVRGGVELLPELSRYKDPLKELQSLYKDSKVQLEEEWAMTRDWSPTAWMSEDAWCRMKLDAFVLVSKTHARVIDYKTGRIQGNEVKHTEQGQLYQLTSFLKYPDLETISVEFWYIDHGPDQDLRLHYTREQGTMYFDKFHNRGVNITECLEFKPNPNVYSCKWCPYNGNACTVGITKKVKFHPPTGTAARFMAKEGGT